MKQKLATITLFSVVCACSDGTYSIDAEAYEANKSSVVYEFSAEGKSYEILIPHDATVSKMSTKEPVSKVSAQYRKSIASPNKRSEALSLLGPDEEFQHECRIHLSDDPNNICVENYTDPRYNGMQCFRLGKQVSKKFISARTCMTNYLGHSWQFMSFASLSIRE